jgi:hypothetical protein
MIGWAFSNTALGHHVETGSKFSAPNSIVQYSRAPPRLKESADWAVAWGILVIARYLLRWICACRTVAGISIDRDAR